MPSVSILRLDCVAPLSLSPHNFDPLLQSVAFEMRRVIKVGFARRQHIILSGFGCGVVHRADKIPGFGDAVPGVELSLAVADVTLLSYRAARSSALTPRFTNWNPPPHP